MPTYNYPPPLLQSASAQNTGAPIDLRAAAPNGYLYYRATANSAIFNIEVAHDLTAWLIQATYTATATQTGTAQMSGTFPYMRANLTKVYSAAGGSAQLDVFYGPGVI